LHDEAAYAAFYKSTWNYTWQSAGYHAIAELDAKGGDWSSALAHIDLSLRVNTENLKARNLKVIALRKLGRCAEADAVLAGTRAVDPMDCWARHLAEDSQGYDNQARIDLSLDYARAGLYADAAAILEAGDFAATDGSAPMCWYALGYLHELSGNAGEARKCYARGASANPDYCFPNRLEEFVILRAAIRSNPRDRRAPYYLGNLLYDRLRHGEAIALWETAARLDPHYPVVWRNLGIAYFNLESSPGKARRAFDKALRSAPTDARVLYERDQLWKRCGEAPARRLRELEKAADLVQLRDDLAIEIAALYNQTGNHEEALRTLHSRHFQPWEGGEGMALEQHTRACLNLGRKALRESKPQDARKYFELALKPPTSLGETSHPLANRSDIYYWLGQALVAEGRNGDARVWYRKAAGAKSDFQEMSVCALSEMTYYSALALRALSRPTQATRVLRDLLAYAEGLLKSEPRIDYFATSLPAMLLFNDDLKARSPVTARFLQAQARLGLGQVSRARQDLRKVLALDCNHGRAADLLAELTPRRGHVR
jgi:tetratricopeptide (TPR) repeat protein